MAVQVSATLDKAKVSGLWSVCVDGEQTSFQQILEKANTGTVCIELMIKSRIPHLCWLQYIGEESQGGEV